jgi:hypothetical protein
MRRRVGGGGGRGLSGGWRGGGRGRTREDAESERDTHLHSLHTLVLCSVQPSDQVQVCTLYSPEVKQISNHTYSLEHLMLVQFYSTSCQAEYIIYVYFHKTQNKSHLIESQMLKLFKKSYFFHTRFLHAKGKFCYEFSGQKAYTFHLRFCYLCSKS